MNTGTSRGRSHAVWWVLGVALASCEPDNSVKPGAPILTAFSVVDPSGQTVALTSDAGPALVPPRSTMIANFDRLLDPAKIEDVTDAGVSGRAGIATITATGSPTVSALYFPNGDATALIPLAFGLPTGPAVFLNPTPSLPSGSSVTIALDPTKLTSKDGKPFMPGPGVAASLTFQTEPFAVSLTLPDPPPNPDAGMEGDGGAGDAGVAAPLPTASGDFSVKVSFNNIPGTNVAAQISAKNGAAPIMLTVTPDENDPATFLVLPAAGAWPAGGTVTITVGADAADAFGIKLGTAVTGQFQVEP